MHRANIPGIAALAAVLLLGGCVASFKQSSEERFSAAPDLTEACRYQWTAGKAYFRAEDNNGFGWTDAANRGFPGLQRNLQDLAGICPGAERKAQAQAQVSAHYFEYADQTNRRAMLVPVVFFELLSFGYAPTDLTNFYAVCVEAATPEGPRRAALAQGKLDTIANVWGASQTPLYPGGTKKWHNKEQLLRELTQQAWHKLWTPEQRLPAGIGCRALLDALDK